MKKAGEPLPSRAEPPAKQARVKTCSTGRVPTTFDDVVEWARDDVGVPDEQAQKLKNHQVDGNSLQRLSTEDFSQICGVVSNVIGIPGGLAVKVAQELRELFKVASQVKPIVPMPDYGDGWQVTGTISNVLNPELKFECDMMIDTGCKVGSLALPKRKVQQLRLEATPKTKRTRTGSAVETVQFYSPVKVELPTKDGPPVFAILEPFVTPLGARLDSGIPEGLLVGPPDPSAPVVSISPVKLPIPSDREDLETPILGAAALRAMGLGIDAKNHCLFATIEEFL